MMSVLASSPTIFTFGVGDTEPFTGANPMGSLVILINIKRLTPPELFDIAFIAVAECNRCHKKLLPRAVLRGVVAANWINE